MRFPCNEHAVALAKALLAHEDVEPIGLGARDSLRLEGGLCLYGNDIDTSTSPVEAALTWAIQKVRRKGGDREGGFPGAARILDELENGAARHPRGPAPRRSRADARRHAALCRGRRRRAGGPCDIGRVRAHDRGADVDGLCSDSGLAAEPGTQLFGEVRGKRQPVTVVAMPFTPANFKR